MSRASIPAAPPIAPAASRGDVLTRTYLHLLGALLALLAGGSILYDTSKLVHRRTRRHVAAALGLFASIAMMFWYVLRSLLACGASRDGEIEGGEQPPAGG